MLVVEVRLRWGVRRKCVCNRSFSCVDIFLFRIFIHRMLCTRFQLSEDIYVTFRSLMSVSLSLASCCRRPVRGHVSIQLVSLVCLQRFLHYMQLPGLIWAFFCLLSSSIMGWLDEILLQASRLQKCVCNHFIHSASFLTSLLSLSLSCISFSFFSVFWGRSEMLLV